MAKHSDSAQKPKRSIILVSKILFSEIAELVNFSHGRKGILKSMLALCILILDCFLSL